MQKRRRFNRTNRSGFTLIELLVVIGILGLLAAILLPVFASVRRKGQQSACVNNLRQIYIACSLYAQDNSGLLPPYPSRAIPLPGANGACVEESGLLLSSLKPYVHSADVWRCPSDMTQPDPQEISCGHPVPDLTSYTYAGFHLIDYGIAPVPIDYTWRNSTMFTSSTRALLEDSYACPSDPQYQEYNHGGRWNRIFMDGHAKSFGLDCTNAPMLTETP